MENECDEGCEDAHHNEADDEKLTESEPATVQPNDGHLRLRVSVSEQEADDAEDEGGKGKKDGQENRESDRLNESVTRNILTSEHLHPLAWLRVYILSKNFGSGIFLYWITIQYNWSGAKTFNLLNNLAT